MKTYNSTNIRNIAVAGHAGRGKTTLCEAMLYTAGATKRLGKVADGTTVMDYDPEEKKRQASLQSAVACRRNVRRPCRAPLHALSGMTSKSI